MRFYVPASRRLKLARESRQAADCGNLSLPYKTRRVLYGKLLLVLNIKTPSRLKKRGGIKKSQFGSVRHGFSQEISKKHGMSQLDTVSLSMSQNVMTEGSRKGKCNEAVV
jgi:hypothetical protein